MAQHVAVLRRDAQAAVAVRREGDAVCAVLPGEPDVGDEVNGVLILPAVGVEPAAHILAGDMRVDQPGEGEELVIRIREELQKINKQRSQAYSAEVSCGLYEVKDASKVALAKALELSDERMYEDKRQRKAQQR